MGGYRVCACGQATGDDPLPGARKVPRPRNCHYRGSYEGQNTGLFNPTLPDPDWSRAFGTRGLPNQSAAGGRERVGTHVSVQHSFYSFSFSLFVTLAFFFFVFRLWYAQGGNHLSEGEKERKIWNHIFCQRHHRSENTERIRRRKVMVSITERWEKQSPTNTSLTSKRGEVRGLNNWAVAFFTMWTDKKQKKKKPTKKNSTARRTDKTDGQLLTAPARNRNVYQGVNTSGTELNKKKNE